MFGRMLLQRTNVREKNIFKDRTILLPNRQTWEMTFGTYFLSKILRRCFGVEAKFVLLSNPLCLQS